MIDQTTPECDTNALSEHPDYPRATAAEKLTGGMRGSTRDSSPLSGTHLVRHGGGTALLGREGWLGSAPPSPAAALPQRVSGSCRPAVLLQRHRAYHSATARAVVPSRVNSNRTSIRR
jgi:hypothetical protein